MALSPRDFRRALRRVSTPAERRLWFIVRADRLDGLKFRRQHSVGRYVVDFYCAEVQLAVELDGSVHDDPLRAAYDSDRQQALEARGLRVLRFSNADVLEQPETVAAAILAAAGRAT